MALKISIVLLFAAFYVSSARVVRDAQNTEVKPITEFFENAGKQFKEMESTLMKAFGVENLNELEKKALDQGKEYANQLDEWAQNIKKETEALKDNESIKNLRTTVDKAIEEFKLSHPDTAEAVKDAVEKAGKGTEEIISKILELKDSEEAKNIQDLSTKLIEAASSTFQKMYQKLQEKN